MASPSIDDSLNRKASYEKYSKAKLTPPQRKIVSSVMKVMNMKL
jgi:hypothetical protein